MGCQELLSRRSCLTTSAIACSPRRKATTPAPLQCALPIDWPRAE